MFKLLNCGFLSIILFVCLIEIVFAIEVNITVSKSPKIVDFVDRLNHPEGTNATIFCAIGSGELNGLTIDWLKDDKRINPSARVKILTSAEGFDSRLRIFDLKPDDSATYSCIANNQYGQDRISTKLFVKVQLKWIDEPAAEIEAHVGKPLQVACRASGKPEPTIEWTRLNEQNGNQYLGTELQFNSLSQEDSGIYECRAKNGVEKDLQARFKLNVLGK